MRTVLAARSQFSLGLGVSSPEDLARAAAVGRLAALAVTDRTSLAALPRLALALPRDVRLICAAEVPVLVAGVARLVFAYARSRAGRAQLCRAVTGKPIADARGLVLVSREPRDLEFLAETFPGSVCAGVEILGGPGRRARLCATAARLGVPVVAIDETVAAAERDRDLAAVLAAPTPRLRLDEAAAREAPESVRSIVAATERLCTDLPDARDLLHGAAVPADDLVAALRVEAARLHIRTRLRPSSAGAFPALDIEPHAGPRLAAAVAARLGGDRLARASEPVRTDLAVAARLAGRALDLGKVRTERLVRAALAEPDEAGGPTGSALAFHRLDPADPAVARAATLVPRIAALPRGLAPGQSLVASADEPVPDRLPTHGAAPLGVVLAEATGLPELGFGVVDLHADQVLGVLGEVARLTGQDGTLPGPTPPADGADDQGFTDAVDLARLEAQSPGAVLCARLRSQAGLGRAEVARVAAAARRRGVRILPARVDRSAWLPTLEDGAVRLGLAALLGPSEELRARWEAMRAEGPPRSLSDLARRSGLPPAALERLAAEGALRPFVRDRRDAVRQVSLLRYREGEELPLFTAR